MNQREDYIKWEEYFMALAKLTAMRSKDPSTQVGAVIVNAENKILSLGYNGAPNNYSDDAFFWNRDKSPLESKYLYVCHSELNAILNYYGNVNDLKECRMYVTLFPCNECAKVIIQSGIKEVIYESDKYANTDATIAAKMMFDTCGVTYRQYKEQNKKLELKI